MWHSEVLSFFLSFFFWYHHNKALCAHCTNNKLIYTLNVRLNQKNKQKKSLRWCLFEHIENSLWHTITSGLSSVSRVSVAAQSAVFAVSLVHEMLRQSGADVFGSWISILVCPSHLLHGYIMKRKMFKRDVIVRQKKTRKQLTY